MLQATSAWTNSQTSAGLPDSTSAAHSRRHSGKTPVQYVTLRRIERAQRMLAETRLPVAAIAKACGFSGASQFGRTFRSVVGTTPLAYRRII
ncbi:MAG: helix-turn-helix transcriptional regulator [Rhizobium sp.]|nr:helix-turn-helix transcriptional regulator [Rhizobium sp.]